MSARKELITPPVEQIELWPLTHVLANPLNPRGVIVPESLDELAASLLEHGVLTPLLAVPAGEFVHLVAGHRRRAAAEIAELRELPVIVHHFSPQEQLEIMLVENLQRADLSPLEEARGYRALMAEGLRKADIARRLSIQARRVQQGLDLLSLDESVARSFDRGELPAMLISEFARVLNPAEQRRYATLAMQRRLNAKELAGYMRQQQSAEAHVTLVAQQQTQEGAAAGHPSTDTSAGAHTEGESLPALSAARAAAVSVRPEAHTRSEAAALISGNATVFIC